MKPVYRIWNNGFGDAWQSLCLLERTAIAKKQEILLSVHSHWGDVRARLNEIIEALEIKNVLLTDEPPNTELSGFDIWACPTLPTVKRWEFNAENRVVVYQFDGDSNAIGKNPPEEDQERIIDYLTDAGFRPIRLGKHFSVQHCVGYAAEAALFVGCDSGMVHVAHSVGTPAYILEYSQPVVTCHRQKQYVLCRGASEFEANVERYLDLLLDLSGESRRCRP